MRTTTACTAQKGWKEERGVADDRHSLVQADGFLSEVSEVMDGHCWWAVCATVRLAVGLAPARLFTAAAHY